MLWRPVRKESLIIPADGVAEVVDDPPYACSVLLPEHVQRARSAAVVVWLRHTL